MVTIETMKATDAFPGIWDRKAIEYFKLTSKGGLEVVVTNWGARLLEVNTEGNEGKTNVVMGYDSLDGYVNDESEHGSLIISRNGNRLQKGGYKDLDDEWVQLDKNEVRSTGTEQNLHGGKVEERWSHRVWLTSVGQDYVEFSLESGDGDQGFPGKVTAYLKVQLTDKNELIIDKYATVKGANSLVNLVSHPYWNLNGVDSDMDVKNHTILTNADRRLIVDGDLIPTGEVIAGVDGTNLDYTTRGEIGEDAKDLDNCLVFPKGVDGEVSIISPFTGIGMDIKTTQKAVQFYGAGHLDCKGLCAEPELPVDLPNQKILHPEFGKGILRPQDEYHETTTYTFRKAA